MALTLRLSTTLTQDERHVIAATRIDPTDATPSTTLTQDERHVIAATRIDPTDATPSTALATTPLADLPSRAQALAQPFTHGPALFAALGGQSLLDHLEQAARQLITLASSLLTVQTPPRYLQLAFVQLCSLVTVVALLGTLVAALVVVMPGANPFAHNEPQRQRTAFDALLRYKNSALRIALLLFALGMLALTAMIITALIATYGAL